MGGMSAGQGVMNAADPGGIWHSKKGDAPSAPDFTSVANQQTAANRPNQTNAFGANSQWSQDPATGKWTQNASLGGPLGTAASSLEQQIAANAGTPLSSGADARKAATDAVYGQETSRLDPQWAQREQDANVQLASQGLDPSSEAGGKALDVVNRARNDAYSSAQRQAITTGGQEAQRQQAMDLTSRMAPEQQLEGLAPLTGQTPAGGDSKLLEAAMAQYQGAMQGYGIQQQGKNSSMSGLSNLGASGLAYAAAA